MHVPFKPRTQDQTKDRYRRWSYFHSQSDSDYQQFSENKCVIST